MAQDRYVVQCSDILGNAKKHLQLDSNNTQQKADLDEGYKVAPSRDDDQKAT